MIRASSTSLVSIETGTAWLALFVVAFIAIFMFFHFYIQPLYEKRKRKK
jgi:hypothetical protein